MKIQKKMLFYGFLLVVLCIAGYSSFRVVSTLYGYHAAEVLYDGIKEKAILEEAAGGEFPVLTIDMEELLLENADFIGWLSYEDGRVSLPIVQERADEVNKYETHGFDGKKSSSGSLFIGYDADQNFSQYNTFIYGHNMKNGSMFGSLKSSYRNNGDRMYPYFYIWTVEKERIKYRVLAAYVTDAESEMQRLADDEEEQKDYYNKMLALGSILEKAPLTETEREILKEQKPLVTLYTCYGKAGTGRRLYIQGMEVLRERMEER